MAKFKMKAKEVEAEQFLESDPPQQWPAGCQVNGNSVTGYSYGTLDITVDPETGAEDKDGFEISNTDWIITNEVGGKIRMLNSEFTALYE